MTKGFVCVVQVRGVARAWGGGGRDNQTRLGHEIRGRIRYRLRARGYHCGEFLLMLEDFGD